MTADPRGEVGLAGVFVKVSRVEAGQELATGGVPLRRNRARRGNKSRTGDGPPRNTQP